MISEKLYKKKSLNETDNHKGVVTHLEPDILQCEVQKALGSTIRNKVCRGDRISAELFQILMMLWKCCSLCQQIWKTQHWTAEFSLQPQRRPVSKNVQTTIWLCSFHMLVRFMLKILQARLQQYVNWKLPYIQTGFRDQRSKCQHLLDHGESKGIPEKCLLHWLC